MVKQNLRRLAYVVTLLSLFLVAGAYLRQRLPALQAPGVRLPVPHHVGDWQCPTVSLDLHVESQGEQLQVSGLETDPVVFERANPESVFQQRGGTRQLRHSWKRLQLVQGDGQVLEFRLRESAR